MSSADEPAGGLDAARKGFSPKSGGCRRAPDWGIVKHAVHCHRTERGPRLCCAISDLCFPEGVVI